MIIDRETGVRELTDILENIITEAGRRGRLQGTAVLKFRLNDQYWLANSVESTTAWAQIPTA